MQITKKVFIAKHNESNKKLFKVMHNKKCYKVFIDIGNVWYIKFK